MANFRIRKLALKSLIIKEFNQLLRDVRMRIVVFGAPIAMLIIFGYAVNTDIKHVTMSVYDEDKSALSRDLLARFSSSGYFEINEIITRPELGDRGLDTGKNNLYIHIPPQFSRNAIAGKSSSLQIIVDGSDSSRAAIIVSYVTEIIQRFTVEKLLPAPIKLLSQNALLKPIEIKERIYYNPQITSRNYFLPGILGLLLSLITIMLTAMSIVKEREIGTIEQIIVSPLSASEYILGKTIPFAAIGIFELVFIASIIILWFKVPFNGSFLFLLFSGFLFICCSLSVGIFISTISRTQQQAMLSSFLFFMPAVFLSGFIFPISSMPVAIQYFTLINPLRFFMEIIRAVFLKGSDFVYLWPQISALFILSIILINISVFRFSRRLS